MGVEDCKEVGGERGGVRTTDKVCVVVPGLEKLGAAKGKHPQVHDWHSGRRC